MSAAPFLAEMIGPDILIILVIVALLFGSSRLPKLARSLGSAKAEFEKASSEGAGSVGISAVARNDETVTLSGAELNAMVAEREAKGRGAAAPSSQEPPLG